MRSKKCTTTLATLMISAFLLAGCSGDSDASNGGEGPGGEPIRIMTIAPVETPIQNYPDAEIGARAAVEAINADGGVNGREIEWDFCNTQSDPNEAVNCARKAASEEVVAVVGQTDAFSTNTIPVLEQAGIPSLGLHSIGNEVEWTNPSSYSFHGGSLAAYSANVNAMKQLGDERIQIIAIDVAASTNQIGYVEAAIEREGLEHSGTTTVPVSGVTDYAPYAQDVLNSEADGLVFITSEAVASAMIKATRSLGGDPHFTYNAFSFGEQQFQALGEDAEKVFVGSPYPTYHETDIAAVEQYNDELDAAGAGDDPALRRLVGFNAWLAVHAFADIAETMEGEITAPTFIETLDTIGEIDLMGIMKWNPSELGTSDTGFARFPETPMHFIALDDDDKLTTMRDLDPVEQPLSGL